ncbi:MAG: hypothetical protein Q8L45_13030 [Xanthomonadaceae bacterium]|nr:hypothetical protein [Xanthomonadaceae bacterium]MDP2185803.1 hypothetical protein [Xanthomonadales bacterium]MDZ4114646.1 hypothetical protein [Xanthomonadaceae bacterium]MDZ4378230.1 hypothetical protein [Xanthomonadaceae bacterium]
MSKTSSLCTLTTVLLLAATAPLAVGQVRGPQVQALPQKLAQPSDPLEQPTPRCFYDASTQFVGMDATQVSAPRKLLRSEPAASGGATATRIQALKPDSDFWITRCPVILKSQHVVNQGAICRPVAIIDADGNGSRLRIAATPAGMMFKIENTSLGKIRGQLTAINNPHGPREVVWLKSSNITANGHALNSHDFYVYLQDVNGYKSYLVEVFDNSDTTCLAAHLPGPNTLCVNADTDASCLRGRALALPKPSTAARSALQLQKGVQASRVAPTTGSEGPGQQTDTGGGHESIER